MNSFSKIEKADRSFNIAFSVIVSVVLSAIIIGTITFFGFYLVPYCWFIYVILILIPAVVLSIAETQGYEYQMAYYKKWIDLILGILDRDKILKDFTKKYRINTYKTKVEDIKADGRWHFKVSTDHVRNLIVKKNTVLLHLSDDKTREETRLNEMISYQEKILANEKSYRESLRKEEKIMIGLLGNAKSTKEVFKQRRDYEILAKKINDSERRINDANYELTVARGRKDKLLKDFENANKKARDYYYLRYQNYTNRAIEKINNINGLKYKIADMGE